MGYGTILSLIDLPWGIFFFIGAVIFGLTFRGTWIPRGVLISFLLFKMAICVIFSIWALTTDQDFDSAGYFVNGQSYADRFGELIRGESMVYLQETPFFGHDGISTDRLNSLTGMLLSLSGRSFMACALALCCLGMIGQLLIFRYVVERFSVANKRYLYLLLFTPSPALWSSLLLKDTLGMFALGLLIYNLDGFLATRRLRSLLLLILGAYVAFEFRSFILVMFFVFSLFLMWDRLIAPRFHNTDQGKFWGLLYVYSALMVSVALLVYYVNIYGDDLVEQQHLTDASYSRIEAGSSFQNAQLGYSASGLLALGVGVSNTLLRPFIWEVTKVNQLLSALESCATLMVFGMGWWAYLYRLNVHNKRYVRSVIYGSLFATIICAAGVGLYSSNLGTISRYRTPVVPIFLMGPCIALGMSRMRSRQGDFGSAGPAPQPIRTRLLK